MQMKRYFGDALILVVVCALVLPFNANAAMEAPHELAGFRLEANVSQIKDKLEMDTAVPVRDMLYLTEVDVVAPAGFKSGQVTYGNCVDPGRIVRISLKYEDASKEFFEKLLDRYKEKFGKPVEWRGDPFHVYVAWKWSFVDKNNNRISMILQHYSGDEDVYKNGNSVKLSMFGLMDQERECYLKKHPSAAQPKAPAKGPSARPVKDFDEYIPRP